MKDSHREHPDDHQRVRVRARFNAIRLAGNLAKREGYIEDYSKIKAGPQGVLRIKLKYSFGGEKALKHIESISTPGCRIYRGVNDFGKVLDGLGIQILSTPKGVKSDKEAKKANVGGEVLARVW